MSLDVYMFPCLSDNYGFLVHDAKSNITACIDTPSSTTIEQALKHKGWQLNYILNTHHHWDHVGDNLALKSKTQCQIVGFSEDKHRIPGIDITLNDGDEFQLGQYTAKILHTPGHTQGHIVYHFESEKIAFVGDTLFALGCGRLLEGNAEQLWRSLQRLMNWPDDTHIYCAHEYTQANARFALSVEPENKALKTRFEQIKQLRANNHATIPTTIGLEKNTNPFLRPMSQHLQDTIGMTDCSELDVFTKTRQLKDKF